MDFVQKLVNQKSILSVLQSQAKFSEYSNMKTMVSETQYAFWSHNLPNGNFVTQSQAQWAGGLRHSIILASLDKMTS